MNQEAGQKQSTAIPSHGVCVISCRDEDNTVVAYFGQLLAKELLTLAVFADEIEVTPHTHSGWAVIGAARLLKKGLAEDEATMDIVKDVRQSLYRAFAIDILLEPGADCQVVMDSVSAILRGTGLTVV